MKLGYPRARSHGTSIPMCLNQDFSRFFLLPEKLLNSEKKHLVGFIESNLVYLKFHLVNQGTLLLSVMALFWETLFLWNFLLFFCYPKNDSTSKKNIWLDLQSESTEIGFFIGKLQLAVKTENQGTLVLAVIALFWDTCFL